MDYDALLKNFDELNNQIEKARQTMRENSKGLIEGATKILFESCPEIKQVHWTQYTPYFNDGEACEFSVNEFNFQLFVDEDFEPYESSMLYTQKQLDSAVKDYETAVAYQANPEAWVENYKKEYKARWGREYSSYYRDQIRPHPYDPKEAQETIDEIKAFMEKIPEKRAAQIEENFKAFKNAMNKIPEDVMEAVYGDHALVIITREGTEIEEYSHD